ncbi:hypothetical protein H9I45_03290 [Polaribacter haliotis]|uniref:histidine kinase n=1 Tax=Polaribacter haliotis TaxID=1888915 RepID=A0A7L8AI78_9FLAO|nr:ATP-binding protein [Polaribacter haliotis]QOD61489.1 hypothetical protein H9I45_03290 [Polaribacter haliotis]
MKFIFILFFSIQSQINTVINYLKVNNFKGANEFILTNDLSYELKNDLNTLMLLNKNIGTISIPKLLLKGDNKKLEYRYLYYLNKGLIEYHNNDNPLEAYNNLIKSLEIGKSIKNRVFILESIRNILIIYCNQGHLLNDKYYKDFLLEYKLNIINSIDFAFYKYFSFKLNLIEKQYKDISYSKYLDTKTYISNIGFNYLSSLQNISNASFQFHIKKNIDSAFHFLTIPNYLNKKFPIEKLVIDKINLNKAKYYLEIDSTKESKRILNLVQLPKKGYLNKNAHIYFLDRKWKLFEKLGDRDSSLIYSNKYLNSSFLAKHYETQHLISDSKTKENTAKKEKEISEEKQKNKQKENLLIASIISLILGTIIALQFLKNSKRKRKLAEQEKELETQKNLTLLKEQEITTINAMVDGQEKERKRIAEDLHDNLGSVLATLKLHFENLQMNKEKKKINQEELFNKTESLIDEAYLKVRSIAHAKNAGVIANQGLLTAVQMMAEKISSADKINIEVIHFGLDKRLENSLEITVFRIIQELITNIIKHAEAKNATINISLYDKNLNIIIEDNGKGFNVKKVNLKDGMGISSIKTRVEHLKGAFEIDATIGKGSSIIIDIPIE